MAIGNDRTPKRENSNFIFQKQFYPKTQIEEEVYENYVNLNINSQSQSQTFFEQLEQKTRKASLIFFQKLIFLFVYLIEYDYISISVSQPKSRIINFPLKFPMLLVKENINIYASMLRSADFVNLIILLMKISLITPEQTRRHQANTSTAKFICAFSKERRFSPPNPECKQAFYLKEKSELSKIRFKIPLSKRSDFTKTLTCSPPSTKYMHKSSIEQVANKGRTFGSSRERSPDRSYILQQLSNVPGPGQYNDKKQGRSSSSYSLRAKTSDFNGDRLSFKQVPGPGTYQDIQLRPKDGKLRLSKFQNTKLAKINSNTKRFLEEKYSPGPSDYVRKDDFSKTGSYMLSKDIGQGRRPFDRSLKIDFTERFRKLSLTVPGPFEYSKPSDFGQYGSSEYYRSFHSTIA